MDIKNQSNFCNFLFFLSFEFGEKYDLDSFCEIDLFMKNGVEIWNCIIPAAEKRQHI